MPKDPSNAPSEVTGDEFVRICEERKAAGKPPLRYLGATLDGKPLGSRSR